MSFTEMVHRKMTGLNILTEIQFWLRFDCTKSVVRWGKIYLGTKPSFFDKKMCSSGAILHTARKLEHPRLLGNLVLRPGVA
jgi:hypothetical protein